MKLKELREVLKYLQDKDSDVLIKDNKDLLQYIQALKTTKEKNDE
jgi:hypothetical protein